MANLSSRLRTGLLGYLGGGSAPSTPSRGASAATPGTPSAGGTPAHASPASTPATHSPSTAEGGLVAGGRALFQQLLRGGEPVQSPPRVHRPVGGLAEVNDPGRAAKLDLACASVFHALQQAQPPAVSAHLQTIATLICDEDAERLPSQPCFRQLLQKGVLERLCTDRVIASVPHAHRDILQLFAVILKRVRHHPVLAHPHFRQALAWTLRACDRVAPSPDLDDALVFLLHTICDCITRDSSLLVLFFEHGNGASQFTVFELLSRYVHMESTALTDRAYDALRLVLHLAVGSDALAEYIATQSNFCELLALGLGGLYSSLPMTLLQADDAHTSRECRLLLRSLSLCGDAVRVGPEGVSAKLLGLLRSGFLQSVLVPSLLQPSDDAAAAATQHLTAMLRSIGEPRVMRHVLDCLFSPAPEGAVPIDVFARRVAEAGDGMCCATLRLFHVLLELNCEDVVFELVLRHLQKGVHVPVGMACCTQDGESLVESARRFLSIAPVTPQSPDKSNFADYLAAAGAAVRHCAWACREWSSPYAVGVGTAPTSAEDSNRTPFDGGPFIRALFLRLRRMLRQPVRTNLVLTAVIARLAVYPQPLLRSFLLDCRLVLAPGVVSLHDVLRKVAGDVSDLARNTHGFAASLLSARAALAHGVVRRASMPDLGGRNRDTADALLAVVCYEEFVKELAAIAEEHVTVSWAPPGEELAAAELPGHREQVVNA